MDVMHQALKVLDEVLSLGGRTVSMGRESHLLGALPELDSMAVVSLISALESHFDIAIDDDDIDGATFATVGSLADLVEAKLQSTSAG